MIARLSLFLTETKTRPDFGSLRPAAWYAFANARPRSSSIPITSPVERISGPRRTSTPGNLLNGKTGTFTEK